MTRIAERQTLLAGETSSLYRKRPLMMIAEPHNVVVYPKYGRELYRVPWLAVFELGQKLAAMEARQLKPKRRKGRA